MMEFVVGKIMVFDVSFIRVNSAGPMGPVGPVGKI
jgi:hypothetical protein